MERTGVRAVNRTSCLAFAVHGSVEAIFGAIHEKSWNRRTRKPAGLREGQSTLYTLEHTSCFEARLRGVFISLCSVEHVCVCVCVRVCLHIPSLCAVSKTDTNLTRSGCLCHLPLVANLTRQVKKGRRKQCVPKHDHQRSIALTPPTHTHTCMHAFTARLGACA